MSNRRLLFYTISLEATEAKSQKNTHQRIRLDPHRSVLFGDVSSEGCSSDLLCSTVGLFYKRSAVEIAHDALEYYSDHH